MASLWKQRRISTAKRGDAEHERQLADVAIILNSNVRMTEKLEKALKRRDRAVRMCDYSRTQHQRWIQMLLSLAEMGRALGSALVVEHMLTAFPRDVETLRPANAVEV